MSQPTLNTSFSGINFIGINRGSRLSYTSLRAASGDNSINEEERLSTPNVHRLGGSAGENIAYQGSTRHSQPDVGRFVFRQETGRQDRLSQPTLVTGDYYPIRGQQRLSQPCLSTGRDSVPTMVLHAPSPPPIKHKRFSPLATVSQRDRLSQLDIGGKYRSWKDTNNSAVKFNRDRFSIPELETQNDLRLIAGTPKQRFSLDSQLTRTQDSGRSRLLPIASSPISEQAKIEEIAASSGTKLARPTREGLEKVIVASTTPILPPGERQLFAADFTSSRVLGFGAKFSFQTTTPATATTKSPGATQPIPPRERMSVPEIRNSSLRRLLDPPMRQRHSITGNLRQCLLSPSKVHDIGRKTSKFSIDEAFEKLKREKEKQKEAEREREKSEEREREREKEINNANIEMSGKPRSPKHIQRHYSYTYDITDESSPVIGKISIPVSSVPRKKFLESNFDENEQVITTVIETDVPVILNPPKYSKKLQGYSSETPKWIRKYMETDSPKIGKKAPAAGGNKESSRSNRKSSRRKSSLESIEADKKPHKTRSKSVSSEERASTMRSASVAQDSKNNLKNTYVKIVPSGNAQENRYEIAVETGWTQDNVRSIYGVEGDDTDSDDSTSI